MSIHTNRPDRRRLARVRFREALVARFGTSAVLVVDLSSLGAGIEHFSPLKRGIEKQLRLTWRDGAIGIPCRVATCRVHRFASGDDGITVYRTGLEFLLGEGIEIDTIKQILTETMDRAFLEQVANERGEFAEGHFREGILMQPSALAGEQSDEIRKLIEKAGFLRFSKVKGRWVRKWTMDPTQPEDGFTISANETQEQIDLLCSLYEKGNDESRGLIRNMATLSVDEQLGQS